MSGHAGFATAYATALLQDAGEIAEPIASASEHPAIAWARSGLMDLTGHAHGPGLMCPLPLAAAADGALIAFATLAERPAIAEMRGAALLAQRARLVALPRNGATSPGGACRLLYAANGVLALSLARAEDWACLPALAGGDIRPGWDGLAVAISRRDVDELLAQARLLGLAAARADVPPECAAWLNVAQCGQARMRPNTQPLVVDLSSLWAGPLCGALLHRAGARVIKIESAQRPDGARRGHAGFYDFLNAGKASVSLDFTDGDALAALKNLIRRADIVIESGRPRALRQLGLRADDLVAERPGLSWISITGHGRSAPQAGWPGFGDDAAAAAGICHSMHAAHGDWMFCGDAIADPLTGLHAAIAAMAAWRQGGGRLISLSLSGVASHCASLLPSRNVARRALDWAHLIREEHVTPLPLPQPTSRARPAGADNRAVFSSMAAAC